ncbi:MAG: response regulator transcription factor, partial [Leptospirales bacterium]
MKQILVVEDDPVISRTLVMSLPYRGYEVRVAGTIQEGRRQFDSGIFDLILLDVQLPDGTGFDLCQGIRARNEWIPILMVTARTDEPSAVMALSIGADDYIRKPFGLDELTARMNRLVDRKAGLKDLLHYRSMRVDRT